MVSLDISDKFCLKDFTFFEGNFSNLVLPKLPSWMLLVWTLSFDVCNFSRSFCTLLSITDLEFIAVSTWLWWLNLCWFWFKIAFDVQNKSSNVVKLFWLSYVPLSLYFIMKEDSVSMDCFAIFWILSPENLLFVLFLAICCSLKVLSILNFNRW